MDSLFIIFCPFSLELLVLILRASFFDKSCQFTLVCDLSPYFAYGSLCRKLKFFYSQVYDVLPYRV